ncbi:MAG TPA: hypothetical protein VKQ89_04260 [Candidatus Angelobacter sp.]|nr:hypothetical protein [Candidatus Angelobacter sp.]
MKKGWITFLVLALLLSSLELSAVDGTFRGKVVDPPANQPAAPGWIFVQGRNRMLRRVEVAHAVVVFAESIPENQRHKCNSDCLAPGQEVRVTARQDSSGEWRAKRVEILYLPTRVAEAGLKTAPLPKLTGALSGAGITRSSVSASHHQRPKSNYRYVGIRRYNQPVLAGEVRS